MYRNEEMVDRVPRANHGALQDGDTEHQEC